MKGVVNQMELFKLHGTIDVDNKNANKALDETSQKGQETQGKMSKFFSGIGKGAAVVGKAVGVGMVAAGTAVAGLATKAIQSYADYEQLVGGVDTLFKNSSAKVQEYAKNAYKTAGLSANEYMETVTSFSASLLQSLDGDTNKAAAAADKAITDMSDNANKMGTSMESIQNAYQGFAKQNYTMLDNLKLGYGGTKEEMARLLADAEKISGQKFDLSSYADVVEAIHVIQDEMGITGTTAKEASSTISGSIASMKGSWQNLLTAISSDDLPFDDYVNSFVDSVSTVAENLMPRIQIALNGIVSLIDKLAPVIIGKIPELVSTLLPSIINAATGLINSIVGIIPDLVSALVGAIPQLIDGFTQIIGALVQAMPQILQQLVAVLPDLIRLVLEALIVLLPQIINSLVEMAVILCQNFGQIIQPIIDMLPELIVMLVTVLLENLPILLSGIGQLIIGICQAIPQLLSALWEAITTLASKATSKLFGKIEGWIRKLFPKSADTILKILATIKDAFVRWIDNLKAIFSVIVSVISTPFKLAWNGIKLIWNNVVAYFKLIWNNIKAIFSVVDSVLSGDFKGAWNGIKKIWSNCVAFFKQIISNVKKAFSNVGEILTAPFRKGKDAIKKIVDNIKGFFTGLKLKFPKIPLPKFGVSPSGWKIGDLLKGKIPKLSIKWHAEAMQKPMIMTKPTVFGYDAGSGKLLGGGEAGSEVVSGTSTLMRMIQSAVSSQNGALVYYLQKLVEMLADYFPQILDEMGKVPVWDTGVAAAQLAPAMNVQLGIIKTKEERGR